MPNNNLTPRELEVMNLIKLGDTSKKIGYTIGATEQTVKNHISTILLKLDAYNRAHAVYLCMKKGLID